MSKKNSKKTVPELRFRGFTDPWEQRQLEELVSDGIIALKRGNVIPRQTGRYPVYSSSTAKDGLFCTSDSFMFDQELVTWSIDGGGKPFYRPRHRFSVTNVCGYALIHNPQTFTYRFLGLAMDRAWTRAHFDYSSKAHPSVIEKMYVLPIPSLPEQHRIGEFFSTLDSLIAAAERQETLLRRKKQAYLQLMFPREGETQPRLRFAGFSGGWERRQLREVAVKTGSGGTPTSSNPRYYGGSIPFLGISDINGRYVDTTQKTLTEEGLANSAAWIVPQGAISLAMYASYGKSAILARPMATSQAFFNIVFRSNVTRDFVFSRLQCAESRHEWDTLVSTGTQPNLSGSKLKKWTIGYPSLPEQHHIGEFFKVLDSLIAAAEERTKALTALKSVYLQRMFA